MGANRSVTPARSLILGIALLLVLPVLGTGGAADAQGVPELSPGSGPIGMVVAEAHEDLVEQMEDAGVDVHHAQRSLGDGRREINALMTPGAQEFWAERGLEITSTSDVPSQDEIAREFSGAAGTPASLARARQGDGPPEEPGSPGQGRSNPGGGKDAIDIPDGPLNVLRADVFTNRDGTFVNVEVWSDDASDEVTFELAGESATLSRFVDSGEYLYHRTSNPLPTDAAPGDTLVVTDDDGDSVTAELTEWIPGVSGGIGHPEGYQWAFVDGYVDAFQSRAKIRELAAEFPELAEIVDLPEDSLGYRRPAMAALGPDASDSYVWAETHVDGHEGGDDYVLEAVDPGAPDSPLSVELDGTTVRVSLGTDSTGASTSTANDVAAAINDSEAGDVVTAWKYAFASGDGVVQPGSDDFDDDLAGPADPSDPLYADLHEPFDIEAIRIGKVRDGSKPGVMAYSQEHAREWVTPLVALETAERLLRNYGTDPRITDLVDNLDIFIIPSVNPDGTNVSMWDDLFQRKNFNQYCEGILAPFLAHSYTGVDLNRNFTVGSNQDGYSGASSTCYSAVYSPGELSEPEARNEVWLTDTYDNIEFSMNTHSFGGYFMWAPGAYIADGRVPLPRPSLGTEDYFWDASSDILSDIKEHRGTVIHPGRTGPVIDVLYSAAGNSADEHYYSDDANLTGDAEPQIYAWNFEVGADLWTGSGWSSPGFFWPDYETEGFDQAMEFTDGWLGFLEVALEHSRDDDAPTATPNVTNGGWYAGPVDVVFETDEPADVYYTTDGSTPTQDSAVVEARRVRDAAEPIEISETTTLRWIAVDAAGNESQPRRVQVRIR
jgi:hypothetical protein